MTTTHFGRRRGHVRIRRDRWYVTSSYIPRMAAKTCRRQKLGTGLNMAKPCNTQPDPQNNPARVSSTPCMVFSAFVKYYGAQNDYNTFFGLRIHFSIAQDICYTRLSDSSLSLSLSFSFFFFFLSLFFFFSLSLSISLYLSPRQIPRIFLGGICSSRRVVKGPLRGVSSVFSGLALLVWYHSFQNHQM